MKGALALRGPVDAPVANDNSSVNITSGAYVALVTSLAAACSAILVQNTSSKAIKIAVGGAGSEVDKFVIAPSMPSILIPIEISKGTRVSAKALGADATTGFTILSFFA